MQIATQYRVDSGLIPVIDKMMTARGNETLKWTGATASKAVNAMPLPSVFSPLASGLRSIGKRLKEQTGATLTATQLAAQIADAGQEAVVFTNDDAESFLKALRRASNGATGSFYTIEEIEEAFKYYLSLFVDAAQDARDAKGNKVFSKGEFQTAFANFLTDGDVSNVDDSDASATEHIEEN